MQTVEVVKNLFVQAGAGWVLWTLFALSAISVAIAVERWVFFRSRSGDARQLAVALDPYLEAGETTDALAVLSSRRSVAAAVARAGLRLSSRGSVAAERGMQSAVAAERKALETRLAFLGTLGNNAPFVGLFGTVIGVILAFERLGQANGMAGTGAASQVASAAVMSAIAEALVATAVGIAVALPAVAAYNYFQRRIATLLDDSEVLSNLVLAYLASPEGAVSHASPPGGNGTKARPRPEAA